MTAVSEVSPAEPGSEGHLDLIEAEDAVDDELDGFVVLWERGEADAEEKAGDEQSNHESMNGDSRGVETPATVDETSSIGGWSEISGSVSSFRSPARVASGQMNGAMGVGSSSTSLSSAVMLPSNNGEDTSKEGSSTLLGSLFSSLSRPAMGAAAAPISGISSSREGHGSGSVPFSWAEIAKIQPKFHNQSGEKPGKLLLAAKPGGSGSSSSSALDVSKSGSATDCGFVGGEADVSLLPSSRKLIVEAPTMIVKMSESEKQSESRDASKSALTDESGAIIDPHSDPFANKGDLGRDARRVGKKQSRIKRSGGKPTKRRASRRKR